MIDRESSNTERPKTNVYWTTRFVGGVTERDALASMYLVETCSRTGQTPEEILIEMKIDNSTVQGLAEDLIAYQASEALKTT